jgi:hypothetical protein
VASYWWPGARRPGPSQGRRPTQAPAAARAARRLDLLCGQIQQRSTAAVVGHLRCLPGRRCERLGPLGTAQAERDNLRMLTAVIERPAERAESAGLVSDQDDGKGCAVIADKVSKP